MTATNTRITADKAYGQDVKTMTYDELMATIRFLDQEREDIRKAVEKKAHNSSDRIEVLKRAA